jgi:hypothetical protein
LSQILFGLLARLFAISCYWIFARLFMPAEQCLL